jgi:hypothetical protein
VIPRKYKNEAAKIRRKKVIIVDPKDPPKYERYSYKPYVPPPETPI